MTTKLFQNEKITVGVNKGGEVLIVHEGGVIMRVTALKDQLQITSVEGNFSSSSTKRGFPAVLLSRHEMGR